jgi:beta-glucosidase
LYAWYPGAQGGQAIAEAIFGQLCPAGRLPMTFPESTSDLPPISDYRMEGRTYRYARRKPQYPFGFGLSYSRFSYSDLALSHEVLAPGGLTVSARVTNTGTGRADEVIQLYVRHEDAPFSCPVFDLRGFSRVSLEPGESMTLRFALDERALSLINPDGKRVLLPGRVSVFVGGSQPDDRSVELMGCAPLRGEVRIDGSERLLPY